MAGRAASVIGSANSTNPTTPIARLWRQRARAAHAVSEKLGPGAHTLVRGVAYCLEQERVWLLKHRELELIAQQGSRALLPGVRAAPENFAYAALDPIRIEVGTVGRFYRAAESIGASIAFRAGRHVMDTMSVRVC